MVVSIHAPRMRGDTPLVPLLLLVACFNPRPSHEGRRDHVAVAVRVAVVSIHAPRMRGDAILRLSASRDAFQSTPLA